MKKLFFFLCLITAVAVNAQPVNRPISQLTTTTNPSGGWVPIVVGGTTYKVSANNIAALYNLGILDSTVVTALHSQAYYDGRYSGMFKPLSYNPNLQTVLNNGSLMSFTNTINANSNQFNFTNTSQFSATTILSGESTNSYITLAPNSVRLRAGGSNDETFFIAQSTGSSANSNNAIKSRNAIGFQRRLLSNYHYVFIDSNRLLLKADTIKVTNPMTYEANYSSTYTARSLVDKGYVDSREQTIQTPRGLKHTGTTTGDTIIFNTFTHVASTTSAATININADTTDMHRITALAANTTIAAPTGTLHDGQPLTLRIKDDGSSRTITWNSVYRTHLDSALPAATVINKTMYLNFRYNAVDSKWDVQAPAWYVGGAAPSVFATWNPADKAAAMILSGGNLAATGSGGGQELVRATLGKSTGKWYWEITLTTGTAARFGIASATENLSDFLGFGTNGFSYEDGGNKVNNNTPVAYGPGISTTHTIGVALDMDAGTLKFYGNTGTDLGVAFTGLTGTYYPALSNGFNVSTQTANFGQTAFVHAVPSGFNAGVY
jgi:hypothetical protein